MNPQNPNRGFVGTTLAEMAQWVTDAFDAVCANITASWAVEHEPDGTHGDITADSANIAGDATIGGDVTVGGDVIAEAGTGTECGIGELFTVGGASFQPAEPIRHGLLLGGRSGFWWQMRPIASPFNGGTNELRLWHLSHDSATAMLRIGRISSVPTIMDGGTGSTPLNLGTSTRPIAIAYADQHFRSDYAAAQGEWTAVTYAAGNFTASAGSWTVDAGDQTVFRYMRIGKTLWIDAVIQGTDVSSAGASLRITLPGGLTCANGVQHIIRISNAGTDGAGLAVIASGSTFIEIYASAAGAGFNATAADNTSVFASVWCEVQ